MIHNMLIGGSAETFAFIVATYPSGSTCKCYDSYNPSVEFTADENNPYVFQIPYASVWYVRITDGTRTIDSDPIVISEYGQSESVTMEWKLWLYKDGVEYADVTGGWESAGYRYVSSDVDNGTYEKRADNIYIATSSGAKCKSAKTVNKVDVSSCSYLKFEFDGNGSYGSSFGLMQEGGSVTRNSAIRYIEDVSSQSATIDISDISGQYYPYALVRNSSAISIHKVWLE